jgi:hypothetical protein
LALASQDQSLLGAAPTKSFRTKTYRAQRCTFIDLRIFARDTKYEVNATHQVERIMAPMTTFFLLFNQMPLASTRTEGPFYCALYDVSIFLELERKRRRLEKGTTVLFHDVIERPTACRILTHGLKTFN